MLDRAKIETSRKGCKVTLLYKPKRQPDRIEIETHTVHAHVETAARSKRDRDRLLWNLPSTHARRNDSSIDRRSGLDSSHHFDVEVTARSDRDRDPCRDCKGDTSPTGRNGSSIDRGSRRQPLGVPRPHHPLASFMSRRVARSRRRCQLLEQPPSRNRNDSSIEMRSRRGEVVTSRVRVKNDSSIDVERIGTGEDATCNARLSLQL